MTSHFPCSSLIRECLWEEIQIEKEIFEKLNYSSQYRNKYWSTCINKARATYLNVKIVKVILKVVQTYTEAFFEYHQYKKYKNYILIANSLI